MIVMKAKWIEYDENGANEYTDFLDRFFIDEIKKTSVIISAETNYELYINGRRMSSGQYHDYADHKVYDEIDITDSLKIGENRIAIIGYRQQTECSCYVRKDLGILFEISSGNSVLTASSDKTLARRSLDYVSGEMDMITGQIGYTFSYDCSKYDNWREPNYDIVGCSNVQELENDSIIFHYAQVIDKSIELFPRPVKQLNLNGGTAQIISQGVFETRETYETLAETLQKAYLSYRHPVELFGCMTTELPCDGLNCKIDGNIYLVIDLRQEMCGYFNIDIDVPKDCDLSVSFGEHLEDLRVRSYISGRCFAFSVKLKVGRNRFCNTMRRLGLRYLMLHLESDEAVLYDANIIRTEYPITENPQDFNDGLWNKIYAVSIHTLKICMHEHYEDTPWREQSLYAMDSRTQMLCGYYAFNEYPFARASLDLLAQSLREDNLISLCSPMTKQSDRLTIMSFSLIYFVQLYEYLLFSGDAEFFSTTMEKVQCVIDNFIGRIEPSGLISNFVSRQHWNFYEWTDGMDGNFDCVPDKRYESPLSAFLSIALQALQKSYLIIGNREKSAYYFDLALKVNKAIDEHFFESKENCYCSFINTTGEKEHFSELTQSLILCCGAAPTKRKDAIINKLILPNSLIKSSLSHSIFKYQALLEQDRSDCEQFVVTEVEQLWGKMLDKGCTSFWETIDGADAFNLAGSLSHGWSAVPIYVFHKITEKNGKGGRKSK